MNINVNTFPYYYGTITSQHGSLFDNYHSCLMKYVLHLNSVINLEQLVLWLISSCYTLLTLQGPVSNVTIPCKELHGGHGIDLMSFILSYLIRKVKNAELTCWIYIFQHWIWNVIWANVTTDIFWLWSLRIHGQPLYCL